MRATHCDNRARILLYRETRLQTGCSVRAGRTSWDHQLIYVPEGSPGVSDWIDRKLLQLLKTSLALPRIGAATHLTSPLRTSREPLARLKTTCTTSPISRPLASWSPAPQQGSAAEATQSSHRSTTQKIRRGRGIYRALLNPTRT